MLMLMLPLLMVMLMLMLMLMLLMLPMLLNADGDVDADSDAAGASTTDYLPPTTDAGDRRRSRLYFLFISNHLGGLAGLDHIVTSWQEKP